MAPDRRTIDESLRTTGRVALGPIALFLTSDLDDWLASVEPEGGAVARHLTGRRHRTRDDAIAECVASVYAQPWHIDAVAAGPLEPADLSHPDLWIEAGADAHPSIIYNALEANRVWPDLRDGIYAVVDRYEDRHGVRYHVEGQCSRLDETRAQYNVGRVVRDYPEARRLILCWLRRAQAFMAAPSE